MRPASCPTSTPFSSGSGHSAAARSRSRRPRASVPRPRLIFAAPLQLGMLAEHELADLFLAERLTRPGLRRPAPGRHAARLSARRPARRLGRRARPGAAARRRRLPSDPADVGTDRVRAAAALLAAEELPREKHRDKKVVAYDLRPLLLDLRVLEADPAAAGEGFVAPDMPVAVAWMRLRHTQDRAAAGPRRWSRRWPTSSASRCSVRPGRANRRPRGQSEPEPAGAADRDSPTRARAPVERGRTRRLGLAGR